MRLAERVAIVTGGASGIGRATARQLAAEGASVVVADINDAGGEETVAQITAAGGIAVYQHADVGDTDQCRGMVQAAVSEFGRLDILHNNAFWNEGGDILEISEEGWAKTLQISLTSIYLGSKHAIPEMRKNACGSIINTASVHSITAFRHWSAYDTAKAGIMGLTRSIAVDFGPEVRCNAVLPGAIYPTAVWDGAPEQARQVFIDGVPMKRIGNPNDIANAVAFLASDEASYITGQGLVVDGGLTMMAAIDPDWPLDD